MPAVPEVTCLQLHAIRRAAANILSLLAAGQRTRLTASKPASSLHLQRGYSPLTHRLRYPTSCTSLTSSSASAQTLSPFTSSQPFTYYFYQARTFHELSGVYTFRKSFYALPTSTSNSRRPLLVSLHCGLCSAPSNSTAMSTLSQPQTPAALDSPLREHRHRPVERLTDRLETPSLDDRKYRVVRLPPNQLEVLLVHDAETDKASAAMDVNVGNFSDEEDMSGMAHAVEHLLFMGTKKVQYFFLLFLDLVV
jgi:hypothetical protein